MNAKTNRRRILKYSAVLSGAFVLAAALAVQSASAASRLEARVLDDATGEPLLARVAVTNAHGQFVEIEGRHAHVQYLDKRWCYVAGAFSLVIPDGGAGIEIRRGLETLPVSMTLAGDKGGKTIQKEFRLRRWVDMRQKSYVCGDVHARISRFRPRRVPRCRRRTCTR
jgi:hypothetical protein